MHKFLFSLAFCLLPLLNPVLAASPQSSAQGAANTVGQHDATVSTPPTPAASAPTADDSMLLQAASSQTARRARNKATVAPDALAARRPPVAPLRTASSTQGELPRHIVMHVGEIRILDIKGIDKVAVGSAKVLSTAVIHKDDDLMILAEDAGESSVLVWNKQGKRYSMQVRVNSKDLARVQAEIHDALKALQPQVNVRNLGEKIVVEGKNLSKEAAQLVEEVVKAYPQASNLTTTQGTVDKTFADMIHFDLQFLEVRKQALENLGVKWDSVTSGGFFFGYLNDIFSNQSQGFRITPRDSAGVDWSKIAPDHKATKWYLGSTLSLGSFINLMVNNGDAFVLASPKLTTRRGGKAKFLAGGEIPLQTVNNLGVTNIIFKQYGILLNIKADWTPDDLIAGEVQAEVSAIDKSTTFQGLPGFLTRRTENEFTLRDGETIILSGLMNKEASKSVDKMPLLGNLPILGAFFRNTDEASKHNELIVFITPRLIKPGSALNQQSIRDGVDALNTQSRALSGADAVETQAERAP
jgi:pilus assembly protein CpaC